MRFGSKKVLICKIEGCGKPPYFHTANLCFEHKLEFEKNRTKKCPNCGKETKQKYCSLQCYMRSNANPAKKEINKKKTSDRLKNNQLSEEQRKKIGLSLRKTLQNKIQKQRLASNGKKMWENLRKDPKKISLMKSRSKRTRENNLSFSAWKHKNDRLFSFFIRKKYEKDGWLQCFTCEKKVSFNDCDCGHYVSRRHLTLRWEEKNAHPQCKYCNRWNHGSLDSYALHLQEKYGEEILKELNKKKNENKKFSRDDLKRIHEELRAKIAVL